MYVNMLSWLYEIIPLVTCNQMNKQQSRPLTKNTMLHLKQQNVRPFMCFHFPVSKYSANEVRM